MKKRNYKKEYNEYHGTLKQKRNRAKRNAARKMLGLKKNDGMEADHKVSLKNGGSNSKRNIRAVKRKTNRKKGSKRK